MSPPVDSAFEDGSPLVRRLPVRGGAVQHLVAVPHAGGGASMFGRWPRSLPDGTAVVAVQLPGREDRCAEPPPSAMPRLVEQIHEALSVLPPHPLTLFGHSLGAYVAFELARLLDGPGPPRLVRLVVSGAHPPDGETVPEPMAHLPDDTLLARLAELGGIPVELLPHRDFLTSILPTLRADLRLAEQYRATPAPPLSCPITVFAGRDDPVVPLFCLDGWAQHSEADVRRIEFDGGHSFVSEHREKVLCVLAGLLATHDGEERA